MTGSGVESGAAVPLHEIGEELQSGAVAFFRMELDGEDISPRYGASKRRRIVRGRRGQRTDRPARGGSCARSRSARPARCRPTAGAAGLAARGLQPMCGTLSRSPSAPTMLASRNRTTRPASGPRQRGRSFLARVEQHLQAEADAEERAVGAAPPARRRAGRSQPGCVMQSGIALWPGSTTRCAPPDHAGVAGHDDRAVGRDVCERLRDRPQVAGAVVDDGDVQASGVRTGTGRRSVAARRATSALPTSLERQCWRRYSCPSSTEIPTPARPRPPSAAPARTP